MQFGLLSSLLQLQQIMQVEENNFFQSLSFLQYIHMPLFLGPSSEN